MPCIVGLPHVGDRGYIVPGNLNGQPLATPEIWQQNEAVVVAVEPFEPEGMQIQARITLPSGVPVTAHIHRTEWSTDTPLPIPE